MSYRVHDITDNTSYNAVIFWDLTNEQDYIDDGVDIINDVVSFELNITNLNTGEITNIDITNDWLDSRESNGLKVDYDAKSSMYEVESILRTASNNLTATSTLPFYQEVKNRVMRSVIRSSWKKSFSQNTVTVRNEIRLKNWLINLEYADELGLTVEANRILEALLKMTGLWIEIP